MVNKVVLVFVVAIGVTAMAVGAFVGMELGGSTAAAPTTTPAGTAGSATPTPSAGPGSGTVTPTATATATSTPTPTPAAADIDAAAVEEAVAETVNDRRRNRGLREIVLLTEIREMARFHSGNMAEVGYLTHDAAGYTTADRYERYDLADRCRIADDTGTGTREDRELEVLGVVDVGEDGRNETELATTAVETWFDDAASRQKLTYENADQVGVGAAVTDRGRVFLTVDLC